MKTLADVKVGDIVWNITPHGARQVEVVGVHTFAIRIGGEKGRWYNLNNGYSGYYYEDQNKLDRIMTGDEYFLKFHRRIDVVRDAEVGDLLYIIRSDGSALPAFVEDVDDYHVYARTVETIKRREVRRYIRNTGMPADASCTGWLSPRNPNQIVPRIPRKPWPKERMPPSSEAIQSIQEVLGEGR